ncbi:MAG TPA: type I restriction enzyme HsdR N-terminal domain-containing protein [Sunxiuqinia sp.]|nr:type I restriction enzyme HsdR N-terminal domain-containing protein [Sunxiuqinia sp.]
MLTELNLPTYSFRIQTQQEKRVIFDEIRRKFVALTPEEWVRQHFVRFLVKEKKYPASLMAIETGLKINRNQFRADLLVYDRKGNPLLLVEFKAPSVKITQQTFDQITRYNMTYKVPYLIVSNGMEHYCCSVDLEKQSYAFLKEIPEFGAL